MQLRKHSCLLCLVSAVLTVWISGCATPLEKAHWRLVEHPRAVVSYPARLGSITGQIVGFPMTVIMLPFSLTIGKRASADDSGKVWIGFYPFVVCRDTGAILVGGAPWLMFGWWGNTEPVRKMPESDLAKPPIGFINKTDG